MAFVVLLRGTTKRSLSVVLLPHHAPPSSFPSFIVLLVPFPRRSRGEGEAWGTIMDEGHEEGGHDIHMAAACLPQLSPLG